VFNQIKTMSTVVLCTVQSYFVQYWKFSVTTAEQK